MRARRVLLSLCLATLALAACRRPDAPPRGEIAGAWLREPELREGFELAPGGALALLGRPDAGGLAWSVTRGELMLSTNSDRTIEPSVSRLQIAALEPERLELASEDESDSWVGAYRRAQVTHVRGVVTYLERMALGPDARVVVELAEAGAGRVATQAFLARGQVPIGFALALTPKPGASYLVSARIGDRERTLFASPEPVAVTPGDDSVEVLLRSAKSD